MSSARQLWVGFAREGGRATVDVGGPGSKVLLLGSRARDLAVLAAFSAKEAGASPIVFDLDGSLARSLSGHLDTYDYRSFLYDSFRLAEPEAWHSQLAAAAYTLALDLSSEEEAIINSAMGLVASDGTLLSPVSLHDVMSKVEGFRGFYVDKLNGRIGALKLFDAVDDRGFDLLARGNLIVDFHKAPYPLAAELSVALFVAKVLAMAHSAGSSDGFLLMSEAHRFFRASPRPSHSNRLLTALLGWSATVVIASDQAPAVSPALLQSCPVRLYSSDAWHSQPRGVERVLSGNFVIHDRRSEVTSAFVPRRVPVKTADYVPGRSGRFPSPDLQRRILEEVDRYPLCTPESLAQFMAPEFLSEDTATTVAALERQECVIVEPKDSGSGPRVFAFTLTEKGRRLLQELRR